ncbi:haloacid dehalogenase-like hydrolase, partial [Allorhizocola rhizosphaerae]|uniref:haloacid dehalogenase-like hydrolase n=1 Tax=Allorhizocola rhizosphaerae TaxID=1872709 RepID=UPI000E3C494D
MECLVLWDIDRTLVRTRGFGRGLLSSAFEATTGLPLLHLPDMAGRTDRALVTWILREHGVAADEPLIEAFYGYMVAAAAQRAELMRANGTALPGSAAAIAALAQTPGVVQSLVTGNLEPVARQKLTVFGLAAGIDFDIGGYGHIGAQRALLVGSACVRAQAKYGTLPPPQRIVVIGDTPHDIEGALACGVRAVGVATGRFSAADLRAAGAHAVLDSLADTAAVLSAAAA